MKQLFIKTLFFVLVSVTVTTNCYAQEPDDILMKMMPKIPESMTEPAQRAEFLVMHFWDNYDLNDTSSMMKEHLFERGFVEYLDILSIVPDETRGKSIHSLMKKSESEPKMFSHILRLSERYLYEPESPLFDEEKLIPFLQYVQQSQMLTDVEKIRPNFLLENVLKNRINNIANDFNYTLLNGETGNLHSINAEYTILYFNDPECEDCIMLIKQLIASPVINNLVKQEKLKIITVYVNDDVEAWEKHSSDVLNSWIYARDLEQKIMFEEIYNIKQFPTMYLLGKEKEVLMKDTTIEKLEDYFNSI